MQPTEFEVDCRFDPVSAVPAGKIICASTAAGSSFSVKTPFEDIYARTSIVWCVFGMGPERTRTVSIRAPLSRSRTPTNVTPICSLSAIDEGCGLRTIVAGPPFLQSVIPPMSPARLERAIAAER